MNDRHSGRGENPRSPNFSNWIPASHVWTLALALFLFGTPIRADWPFIWDFDERSDNPVAAHCAPGGDLVVLVQAHRQGLAGASAIVLRINPSGELVWTAEDHNVPGPTALALGNNDRALVLGRAGTDLQITSIASNGAIEWSRNRSGITQEFPEYGPYAQPVWDPAASAWRVPAGIDGDFVVLSWTGDGDPLPDRLWSPPSGEAVATAVAPGSAGGLLVTGRGEATALGWWTVALDDTGTEIWRHFEDGGTDVNIFSGAFPVVADEERITIWADDETMCGLFSLRLWSLDAATGTPLWDTTWPPPGDCSFFIPDMVQLSGDRILASGEFTFESSSNMAAIAFDAATGATVWERGFSGSTSVNRAVLSSPGGSALVASTLVPPAIPGPGPLWLNAWNRSGEECTAPLEILPAWAVTSLVSPNGSWYIIGSRWSSATANDLVVQVATDPCGGLFADGFESGDTRNWNSP